MSHSQVVHVDIHGQQYALRTDLEPARSPGTEAPHWAAAEWLGEGASGGYQGLR